MKQKTLIFLVLTVLYISCYNELTARESIGTLNIYRTKKDLVIHGVNFKKGEIVACDGGVLKIEEMGYSVGLSFTKKKNYYIVKHWNPNYGVPNVRIPAQNITQETLKKHQLLVSDIGDFTTFVSKSGKKVRIFRCKLNGYHFTAFGDEIINVNQKDFYLLCFDNYFAQLEIKNEHFKLYDFDLDLGDDFKPEGKGSIVHNGEYKNSFEQCFDKNGNMLCDLDINDGNFNGEYYGAARPNVILPIAYLHETNEIFLDGEFYKMTEKDGQPVENVGANVKDKQLTTSTVPNNSTNKLTITKKKKTGYLKFRDEPQYMIINVDIDWPVSNNGKSITALQKKIIYASFERNTNNIDAIIQEYCTNRSGGKVVSTIPKAVKQQKVPWYQDDLEVKCTQVAGLYASFQIDGNTFNGYHGLPTYRKHINYDINNNKIIELNDIIINTKDRQFEEFLSSRIKAIPNANLPDYKDRNGLKIAGFALRANSVVLNFDDDVEGYLEIEISKERLAKFLTEYGKSILQISNN